VAGADRAVRGNACTVHFAGRRAGALRIEDEEHARSAAEEDMPPGLTAEHVEAQHRREESFGGVEVFGVETRFEHGGD
jgi:hypothetical protein